MDDTQIVISLDDDRAKYIAEVISNKSCKKILDHLSRQEGAVSEVANDLKMPINTVDYNIKKLIKSGLIEKANYWWSVKGKKMPTYKVSNKKIIISPRKSVAKVFAWTLGLTGLTALTIRELLGRTTQDLTVNEAASVFSEQMATTGAQKAISATTDSAPIILEGASNSGAGLLSTITNLGPWAWFLIGAWFAVFLFFTITLINDGRHRL